MNVAGVRLSDREVLTLTALLRKEGFASIAIRLERSFDEVLTDESVHPSETDDFLRALASCPPELTELRRSLLLTRTHRVRSSAARRLAAATAVVERSMCARDAAERTRERARTLRQERQATGSYSAATP